MVIQHARDPAAASIDDLFSQIANDVKTLAKDEIELVRGELSTTARSAAADAAIVLCGAIVALIGLGMLCAVAVAALAPVIPELWLRLLLSALAYLALGGTLGLIFARRLRRDIHPHLAVSAFEAKRTVRGAMSAVRDAT